jgi:cytochrome c oxidase assembly protein subunit 15
LDAFHPGSGPEMVTPEGLVPDTVVGWIFDEAQDASRLLDMACQRLLTGDACKWAWAVGVTALLWVQIALGGWVSTNYAVLACTGFPTCNGQWWPEMNFGEGFTLLRELGRSGEGSFIPMQALVAIHMVHRIVALVLFAGLCVLAWRLWAGADAAMRRTAVWLLGLALWQMISGLSNVVLGWPLLAAVMHTGGAAAMALTLTWALSVSRADNSGLPSYSKKLVE